MLVLKSLAQIGKEKTIWFNCRQEPVAYVNGISVTPRCLNAFPIQTIFELNINLNRSKKNPHVNIESTDCLEVSKVHSL